MALTPRKKGLSPDLGSLDLCSKILFQKLRAPLKPQDEASCEVYEVIFHLVANVEVKVGQNEFCVTFHDAAYGGAGISR